MYRIIVIAAVLFCFLTANVRAEELRLWFYLPTNLLVDENVDKGIELLNRAAKAGYNGVLLADSKFSRWGDLPDRYTKNVKRFRDECRRLKLDCFAAVCPVGYSNDLLNLDPNLAEGLPTKNVPFVVKNGTLIPKQPAEPMLKNGGFEDFRNNNPTGWGFVDEPGKISFIDTEIKSEGTASLRMQDNGDDGYRNARVMQKLEVEPFHYYHLSLMLKTENFESIAATNIAVLAPDGRGLNWHMPPLKKTEDWRRVDITFNSLDNKTLNLYIGTWGATKGNIWFDGVKLEPAGFVNILRRDGAPLVVKSEDGKTVYDEGKDFDKIIDPKMGNEPFAGSYNAWHEQPTIRIPDESRLKEGDCVLVDYTHASIVYGEQVAGCFADPKFKEMLRWQIEQVHKNVEPDGYFMSHDEIRQCGWDESCEKTEKTPAEMLAENVAWCVQTIQNEAPGKPIAVWSDMFDPTHNAQQKGKYYLVKGDGPWYGSWKGLPKDVIVANWNSNPKIRTESLKHFSDHGNPQILAGYYDAEPIDAIRQWIQDAKKFDGFCGVMYTTWENRYNRLEAFAESVKSEWDANQ